MIIIQPTNEQISGQGGWIFTGERNGSELRVWFHCSYKLSAVLCHSALNGAIGTVSANNVK